MSQFVAIEVLYPLESLGRDSILVGSVSFDVQVWRGTVA